MKKIKFHIDCQDDEDKWDAATQLLEVVRAWCNAQRAGMTAKESRAWNLAVGRPYNEAVWKEINIVHSKAIIDNHWNPRVPDHASGGNIHYPPGLNQGHSGHRNFFLVGLQHTLMNNNGEQEDINAAEDALMVAREDATNNGTWDLTMEDIIDVD